MKEILRFCMNNEKEGTAKNEGDINNFPLIYLLGLVNSLFRIL